MSTIIKPLVLILLFSQIAYAQKEANIWYFGFYSGLDFSSGTPVPLADGQISTKEGVASICDKSGNLLFYTEGITVWNRQHVIMPNGTGLFGDVSSTQSAIVVPWPEDPSRYFLFTVDFQGGPHGLRYSVINMTLDNGLGDVELKNVPLLAPVCEKITAVKHCNGTDIWVITHAYNSADYYAYLVTPAGVSTTPVISTAGAFITEVNFTPYGTVGYLKASPDGKKLAAAHRSVGVDLLDFDNITGQVSNGRSLFLPGEPYLNLYGPYGVEFSPDSRLLYVTVNYEDPPQTAIRYSDILQYNSTLPDQASIAASKKVIYHYNSDGEKMGALQTGPDGKIYLAEFFLPYLSVINRPDSIGTACQFVHGQLSLGGDPHLSAYGLPSFIQSFWWPGFSVRGACGNSPINFDYERPADVTSVKWDFGDPASGINNTSAIDSSQHLFSADGIYTVKLIRYKACGNDTVMKQVQSGEAVVDLGKDTTLCGNNNYLLQPNISTAGNYSYIWQNGSTNPTYSANQDGIYWVEVRNISSGCTIRDSVQLIFKPVPNFSLGSDLIKCSDEQVTLSINVPGTFSWSTGNTTNGQVVQQSGIYWLDVTQNGCTTRDSVTVTFNQVPYVNLGKDTTVCENQQLLLDAQNLGATYRWQDNSTNQSFSVNSPGKYFVKITKDGCSYSDTIQVQYELKPSFTLGSDFGICDGQSVLLEPVITSNLPTSYLWQSGSTTSSFIITQPGSYSLDVSNFCGTTSDAINVAKGVCQLYVPTAFSPNGDGLNDVFRAGYGENVVEFQMEIYNRWGQQIFHSKKISEGWNGTSNGAKQPDGVYVWIIRYKIANELNENLLKGTLTLVR